MKRVRWTARLVILALGSLNHAVATPPSPRFDVKLLASARTQPVDGRLMLVVSQKLEGEPRSQVSWGKDTQQVFAVDVNGLRPGQTVRVGSSAVGFPLASVRELPAGSYNVQAVLHVYETVRRADGHVLKLPMDDGEGQDWSRSPGNLYSTPKQVAFDARGAFSLELSEVIPEVPVPKDTKYVRPDQRGERAPVALLGPPARAAGDRAGSRRLRREPAAAVSSGLPAGPLPRRLPLVP